MGGYDTQRVGTYNQLPLSQQNDALYRDTYANNPNQINVNRNTTNPLVDMNQSIMNQQQTVEHKQGFFNRISNFFRSDNEPVYDTNLYESRKENVQVQPPLISQQNNTLYRETDYLNKTGMNQQNTINPNLTTTPVNLNQSYTTPASMNQSYTTPINVNQSSMNQNDLNQSNLNQTNLNQSNLNQNQTT